MLSMNEESYPRLEVSLGYLPDIDGNQPVPYANPELMGFEAALGDSIYL